MRRASLTIAVAVAFSMLLAPAAAAPRTPKRATCNAAHSKTVAQNAFARVFSRPSTSTNGIDLVGCWKSTGRRRLLATAFDGESASADFGLVRLQGRFAAFHTQARTYDCSPECPPEPATAHKLERMDLRSGTRRPAVRVDARPLRLLLDGRGDLAWPRARDAGATELRVVDAAGERAVDSGPIPPQSIALTPGGRLTWVNAGVARSAVLGVPGD